MLFRSPSLITTFFISSFPEKGSDSLDIFPEPLIVSTPVVLSKVYVTFVPQEPLAGVAAQALLPEMSVGIVSAVTNANTRKNLKNSLFFLSFTFITVSLDLS